MKIDDIKPIMSFVDKSERLIADQGYSFNEAGQSFNEAGVMFGGIYGIEGHEPTLEIYNYKPL